MKITPQMRTAQKPEVCENRPTLVPSGVFQQVFASHISPASQFPRELSSAGATIDEAAKAKAPVASQAPMKMSGVSVKDLLDTEALAIEATAMALEKSLSGAAREESTKIIGDDKTSIVVGSRGKTADPWDRYRSAANTGGRESGRGFYVGIRIAIG